MKLDQLSKTTTTSKKRIGRGLGSGKGKTGGRGQKGQKSRGRVALGFIGGTLPFYKKMPFNRGYGNSKKSFKALTLPVSKLSVFENGAVVDLQNLINHGLIKEQDARKHGVKIMSGGEINKKLTVSVPTSASAAEKIEKAGGKIVRG